MYLGQEGNFHGKDWIQHQILEKLWHLTLPLSAANQKVPYPQPRGAGCPVVPMKQVSV